MSTLATIREKIELGERLTSADAQWLFTSCDILDLGALAHRQNLKRNGGSVFYNVNRHINPTNVCALSCKFCAFSRKPGEDGAYTLTVDEIVERAGVAVRDGATEVHMVGGLHPRWKFSHYTDIIRGVRHAFPDLHIKAFTAVELDWMARRERRDVGEILRDLVEAGLGSLPGGGAEIFAPEIRDAICDTKVSAERWLDIHRTAHALGIRSNATMLYGHVEAVHHRVNHMERLRALQDETGGFNVFIPLAFQPHHNEMGITRYTRGCDDLRTIAVARLFLDNFAHVKAYWVMLGQDIAQLGLLFGANDLDGTVVEEKISRMAGGRSGMVMDRLGIETLINQIGGHAVERDTLYRPVARQLEPSPADAQPQAGEAPPGTRRFREMIVGDVWQKYADGAVLDAEEWMVLGIAGDFYRLLEAAVEIRDGLHGRNIRAARTLTVPGNAGEEEIQHALADLTDVDAIAVNFAEWQAARQDHNRPGAETNELRNTAAAAGNGDFAAFRAWVQTVHTLVRSRWATGLEVHGFAALAKEIEKSDCPGLAAGFAALRGAGVTLLISTAADRDMDWSDDRVLEIHRAAHAADLATVGRAELGCRENEPEERAWTRFVRRLVALDTGLRRSHGLRGILVSSDSAATTTPARFARALALGRLVCRDIGSYGISIDSLASLSPGGDVAGAAHPAEKFAPFLAALCGIDDLGTLPRRQAATVGVLLRSDLADLGLGVEWRRSDYHSVASSHQAPTDDDLARCTLISPPPTLKNMRQ